MEVPEIHIKFLGLGCVEIQVIEETAVTRVLDLLPVGQFIFVCDQAYNSDVISKLADGIGGMDGGQS